ncbi:MAG: biotin--[acetyl-CoA-carboxylase] ligase [bacterium]|nr:biotin--[acetyl-CoA-carboxylase] ligase [Candidatus Sumerlaeota bacterium]
MKREDIMDQISPIALVRHIYHLHEADSTSDWLKRLVKRTQGSADVDGTLMIADHQTAGRGRFQRAWHAPAGKALLFSLILMNTPERDGAVALAAPVSVCLAIASVAGLQARIKYPNDILVNGKKAAGILIERCVASQREFLVTGIGINVNQSHVELPRNARIAPGSLAVEAGREIPLLALLSHVLRQLENMLNPVNGTTLIWHMNALCDTLGRHVEVETASGPIAGTAISVTPEGALVIQTESGLPRIVHSGDVRMLRSGSASEP